MPKLLVQPRPVAGENCVEFSTGPKIKISLPHAKAPALAEADVCTLLALRRLPGSMDLGSHRYTVM